MRNKQHQHRARAGAKSCIVGWSHCVTPDECAANPQRQSAHGNITEIVTCRCGAVRHTEINNGVANHGPWTVYITPSDAAWTEAQRKTPEAAS